MKAEVVNWKQLCDAVGLILRAEEDA
jgi:hypothetical protein